MTAHRGFSADGDPIPGESCGSDDTFTFTDEDWAQTWLEENDR
jgi:hypothetical protein